MLKDIASAVSQLASYAAIHQHYSAQIPRFEPKKTSCLEGDELLGEKRGMMHEVIPEEG